MRENKRQKKRDMWREKRELGIDEDRQRKRKSEEGKYRNDISIKSSNVKLNINDVCNLIKTLKTRLTRAFLIKKLIKRELSKHILI